VQRSVAILSVLVLAIAACSSPAEGDPAGGDAGFCQALTQYNQSLVKLRDLPPESTVADLGSAMDDVKVQLAALDAVSGEFAGAQLEELHMAQDGLAAAVDGIPADATPADAENATADAIDQVIEASSQLDQALCNTNPTPSA
jgi:hypothetical protein